MHITIIIPAYNEQNRIQSTLEIYNNFFLQKYTETGLGYELLVVINGTTDATKSIVQSLQQTMPYLRMLEIKQGGKGLALTHGFKNALERPTDLIGFVDADQATSPQIYYQLVTQINNYDGIIASRYMPGALVVPPRPWIKRWGSKLFFESLVRWLFGLHYYDTQCGAKLFKRAVIEKIAPNLHVRQWAFDVELLYVCKQLGFTITETPTIWRDQAGSKLRILHAGLPMLSSLITMRWHYWFSPLN